MSDLDPSELAAVLRIADQHERGDTSEPIPPNVIRTLVRAHFTQAAAVHEALDRYARAAGSGFPVSTDTLERVLRIVRAAEPGEEDEDD